MVARLGSVLLAAAVSLASMLPGPSLSPQVSTASTGLSRFAKRCVLAAVGAGARRRATAVPGSARSEVLEHFTQLQSAPPAVLPASVGVARVLAGGEARSYDPTRIVLFATLARGALYAVPAMISRPRLPAGCATVPRLAGIGEFVALDVLVHGSGPGVCMIQTETEPGPSGPAVGAAGVACESLSAITSWTGAMPFLGQHVLVPDGISTLTYTQLGQRRTSIAASGNLATPPKGLVPTQRGAPRDRVYLRRLARLLPTSITATGAGPFARAVTYARPAGLIAEIRRELLFVHRVLANGKPEPF